MKLFQLLWTYMWVGLTLWKHNKKITTYERLNESVIDTLKRNYSFFKKWLIVGPFFEDTKSDAVF